MKKQLFTTDEAIIAEHSQLYDELGETTEYCNALKELEKNIIPEKKQLWKPILKGIRYNIEGNMAKSQFKPYENLFKKSCQEFDKVEITDNKSLISIFVERNKLFALADMDKANIDKVISGFKSIIEKFENSKTTAIQEQVVITMLNASYYLAEIERFEEAIEIQNKAIEKFKNHESAKIQYTIAICKNNQASDLKLLVEKQSKKLQDSIIEQYQNSKDPKFSIQVSKAMYNQAISLYQKSMQKFIIGEKEKYQQQAVEIFSELIEKFNDSTILNIKKDVLLSMYTIGEIWRRQDELEKALKVYSELVGRYKNEKEFLFKLFVVSTLETIAKIHKEQYQQATNENDKTYYLSLAVNVYTNIVNEYENDNEFEHNTIFALQEKGHLLFQLNYVDEALGIYNEIIEKCKNQDYFFPVLLDTLESKGDILKDQSYVNKNKIDAEKAELAIQVYSDLLGLFEKHDIHSFRVVATMMKKATLLLDLKHNDNAIKIFEKSIIYCSSNEYKKNDRFQIAAKDAKTKIVLAMNNKAIELMDNKHYKEAIAEWDKIIELCNTDNYKNEEEISTILEFVESNKQFTEKHLIPFEKLINFYPQNEQNIQTLMNSIASRRLIPIIGAGLSRFAGYPLWGEFLEDVYNRNEKMMSVRKSDFLEKDYKDQAQLLFDDLGKRIFEQEVRHTFADKDMPETIKEEAIWWIPYFFPNSLILTTNFDNVTQRAYGQRGIAIYPYTSDDIENLRRRDANTSILYKTHGSVAPFTNIILTQKEYEKHYGKDSDNYKILSANMQGHDRLFLGCSLEDDEILSFCGGATNFTIYPCKEDEIIKVVRKLSNKGISVPILYPINEDSDHSYLKFILEFMAMQMKMNH